MTKTRDYFAEMYVAGLLADEGWNVYFPHRDVGFDMIATFNQIETLVIRPVQVKGLYPRPEKSKKAAYGYVGKLSALHPEMVLAITFFPAEHSRSPDHVAWMPRSQIRVGSKGYRCQPARYDGTRAVIRRDYERFFDDAGLAAMRTPDFAEAQIGPVAKGGQP